MQQFAADFTGDGWPDVLCSNLGTPVFLYVNPKGESRRWDKFQVVRQVRCEIMELKDIDGDGKPEVIYTADDDIALCQARSRQSDRTVGRAQHLRERLRRPFTALGPATSTAMDAWTSSMCFGWWENPGPGGKEPWTYHPQAFGRWARSGPGGALMAVYDVNGDGLNDVVTSLGAHDFGLAWYEQKRDAAGKISFVEHIDHEGLLDREENAGGVTFSQVARLGLRRYRWRRRAGLHRGQTLLVAPG